jgi:hypothetical protein
MKTKIVLITLALFLAACDQSAQPETTASAEPPPTIQPEQVAAPEPAEEDVKGDIEWFEGSVEEAFALAQAEDRPLFLYWGAVWCPPCIEIKNTVFKSPQFIAQTELFIPVYLDGDTERAQTWGDTFDTKVYPTMIVFNPAGQEVTRLNAGIDISAYNTVLELSLDSMKPMGEVVAAAMQDASTLTAAEIQRLAYYSWYDGKALPEDTPAELFRTLSSVAVESSLEAGARLYLQYLVMLAGEEATDPEAISKLGAILSNPALTFASWDYLIVPERMVATLEGSEDEIAALKHGWASVMLDSRHDERLSTKNQLYGWRPYLVFHYEGDDDKTRPLPEDMVSAIRADGRAADQSVAGTHSRQSVINTASNVYVLAGLTDDARALLTAEIEKSVTPYYFMGSLASLEEDAGNTAVALEWRRKAYEASEGPATRIRWWASYVQALTRLAPEDEATILAAALHPFDEEHGMDDLFHGANYRNLERAMGSLDEWDTDGTKLDDFHAAFDAACSVADADCTEMM